MEGYMNKNLTCNQVISLINFYITGELNKNLKEYVDSHLSKCPRCRRKVEELKSVLLKYENIKSEILKENNANYPAPSFIDNLSAYVDKELATNENIKIKKLTISNPKARKQLEELYKFQKIMQYAYEKTKSNAKFDYSKTIMSQILNPEEYTTVYFYKLLIVFCALIIGIIAGFVYLYL